MNQQGMLKLLYGNVSFLPITKEVIAKFVAQGADESDLRLLIEQGALYCPERNSFVLPPEQDQKAEKPA